MSTIKPMRPLQYRSIFISDVHLGFRGCQATFLLDFLNASKSEYLYLIGDIFDGWEMKKRPYWPDSHQDVVKLILQKAAAGTRVIYTPGNHDESARAYCGHAFDNIQIQETAVHETADSKKLLILHGDQFDTVVKISPWLAKMGSSMYGYLLYANRLINGVRSLFGIPYWSLAAHLKHRVKNVVSYIGRFEEAVVNSTRSQHLDGVICGHIHHAEMRHFGETLYCNTGDWVESCTALVERHDGTLEILKWTELAASLKTGATGEADPRTQSVLDAA